MVRSAKLVQIIEFKQWRYPQNMNNLGIWDIFEKIEMVQNSFYSENNINVVNNGQFSVKNDSKYGFIPNDSSEKQIFNFFLLIGTDFFMRISNLIFLKPLLWAYIVIFEGKSQRKMTGVDSRIFTNSPFTWLFEFFKKYTFLEWSILGKSRKSLNHVNSDSDFAQNIPGWFILDKSCYSDQTAWNHKIVHGKPSDLHELTSILVTDIGDEMSLR